MKITYNSNNSGGRWWLKDKDWKNLEKKGWKVEWYGPKNNPLGMLDKSGNRFLGALATIASKNFKTVGDAIKEFEKITGQDASDEGCNCCGPPHTFTWDDNGYNYISGENVLEYLFEGDTKKTKRQLLESQHK
jgi:hypothetical protein